MKLAAAVVFLLVAAASLAAQRGGGNGGGAPGASSNPLGLLLSLGPGVAFLVQFFQSTRAKIARNVVVEPDAVLVDGYPIFRRDQVTRVTRKIASIEVARGFFRAPCELTFSKEDEAKAFDVLLGTPAADARAAAELPAQMSATAWMFLSRSIPLLALVITLVSTTLFGALLGPIYAFVPLGGFAVFYLGVTRVPHLSAGTDGVRIGRRLGDEFVSYDRVRAVKGTRYASPFHRAAVVITIDRGAKRFVGFGMDALAEQRAASTLGKITRQLKAYRDAPEPKALPRVIGDTAEWLTQLRGVAGGASGDHRSLALHGEAIRDALKNPRADAKTRAAAAFGMATTAAGKTEVELVASRTVDPRLRNALEQIAHADAKSFARVVDALGPEG